jgi:hypothetical protein
MHRQLARVTDSRIDRSQMPTRVSAEGEFSILAVLTQLNERPAKSVILEL